MAGYQEVRSRSFQQLNASDTVTFVWGKDPNWTHVPYREIQSIEYVRQVLPKNRSPSLGVYRPVEEIRHYIDIRTTTGLVSLMAGPRDASDLGAHQN